MRAARHCFDAASTSNLISALHELAAAIETLVPSPLLCASSRLLISSSSSSSSPPHLLCSPPFLHVQVQLHYASGIGQPIGADVPMVRPDLLSFLPLHLRKNTSSLHTS